MLTPLSVALVRKEVSKRNASAPGHQAASIAAGRVRHVGEKLGERRPHTVLAVQGTRRADEDGVVGVVGNDPLKVSAAERLGVMLEDFLGRACH